MDSGRVLIVVGSLVLLIGLMITYTPGLINWFGKLPGDIHIKKMNSSIFIPLTSMVIISVVLSLIVNWFLRK